MRSDIFFFVTTIAVVIVTLMVLVIGFYVIKILREIRMAIKDVKLRYQVIKKIIRHLIK